MEILEVTGERYKELAGTPFHVFASAIFSQLNSSKCDRVVFLLFIQGKPKIGIAGGIKKGVFRSPFSAPFCGLVPIDEKARIKDLEESVRLLKDWSARNNISEIVITLPPFFYNESFISKQYNVLYRGGFSLKAIDLNYDFRTSALDNDYLDSLWRNARKNLNIALNLDLNFKKCESEDEMEVVYGIIKANRDIRGFPLKMSWSNVKETIEIIKADFFLVSIHTGENVASAIVFHSAAGIAQVVYWGDLPEYSEMKTMNFLSFRIFEYYRSAGIGIIDIGPSTENSIPNYGLGEFKESIGCNISVKSTFSIKI